MNIRNDVKPVTFWRSLFCRHIWQEIPSLKFFSPEDKTLPTDMFKRWECTKCGIIKKYRIL